MRRCSLALSLHLCDLCYCRPGSHLCAIYLAVFFVCQLTGSRLCFICCFSLSFLPGPWCLALPNSFGPGCCERTFFSTKNSISLRLRRLVFDLFVLFALPLFLENCCPTSHFSVLPEYNKTSVAKGPFSLCRRNVYQRRNRHLTAVSLL